MFFNKHKENPVFFLETQNVILFHRINETEKKD